MTWFPRHHTAHSAGPEAATPLWTEAMHWDARRATVHRPPARVWRCGRCAISPLAAEGPGQGRCIARAQVRKTA
jgi:hypothetical protein